MTTTRDTLFLLTPGFADPAYPGVSFFCGHCAMIEGVLTHLGHQPEALEVRRIAFPRPRAEVVALVGEANQSLPLLLLADDAPAGLETGSFQGRRFVQGLTRILDVLARRHGFPVVHP